jgi:hydroxyethylthiazole kinase-like sugar kinase family protein
MFPFTRKKTDHITDEKSENVAKKSIKTMDTVVTGMILGGIVASLYGVKKLRDKKNLSDKEIHDDHHK